MTFLVGALRLLVTERRTQAVYEFHALHYAALLLDSSGHDLTGYLSDPH